MTFLCVEARSLIVSGMRERPDHKPYPAEKARQLALTKRLVIVIGVLLGVIAGVLIARFWGR
jgi:hypothetical protein